MQHTNLTRFMWCTLMNWQPSMKSQCVVFSLSFSLNPVLNSHEQYSLNKKTLPLTLILPHGQAKYALAPPLTRTLPPLWFCSLDHNSSEKT